MKRWCWHAARALRGIGLPGWVALLLAAASIVGQWIVIEPLRSEARQLDVDSDQMAQRLRATASLEGVASATPQQQLALFRQRFPTQQGLAGSLASLQAVAQRQGVRLDRAEFRFTAQSDEALAGYAITLPIQADYLALRRFAREAMRELPGLALEEVNLRRGDPKSPLLDAQLRFVLFVDQTPVSMSATLSRVAQAAAPSN